MVRPGIVMAVVACATVALPTLRSPHASASTIPHRLGMYSTSGGAPLAMLDSDVAIRVRGPLVEATISQTFRNDTDHVTEATYIFPLPVDAAVSAMSITTGTRTIHAAIEPRDQAQRRYEAAVSAGLAAGLLDQERPDVFTQTVAAIPAHGAVTVTLRVDSVAIAHDGQWTLSLPLVVAPRYVPGTASGRPTTGGGHAPDTDRAPDASRVTPNAAPGAGGKTSVTIEFADPVDDVTSPSHELARTGERYAFVDPHSDHDAIVRWRARVPSEGWVEHDGDGGYAAVLVSAPPAVPRTAALRCLLVLDRAATTRGDADAVERPLVRALVAALTANDRIAIAGDVLDWRAPEQAQRAIDDSWTGSASAFDLTRVLAAARPGGAAVVLVTDGLVADDRAAAAAAKRLGVAIHVIGVGPAPNRALLAAIANASGGTLRFAAIDDDLAALARDTLSDAASSPTPLAVSWGTLGASDVVPATLPRLGAGQSALVVSRVKQVQAANARARGDVFAFATITPTRTPDGATSPHGGLARAWARIKLGELLAANDSRAAAAHALHYGLVSPQTSMVAIGDDVIVEGGVKHSVAVPVSLPSGMHWQTVHHATSVDTTISARDEEDASGRKAAREHAEDQRAKTEAKHTQATAHDAKRPAGGTSAGAAGAGAPGPVAGATTQPTTPPNAPKAATADKPEAATGADDGEADNDQYEVARRQPVAVAPEPMATRPEDYVLASESVRIHDRLRLTAGLGGGLAISRGATDGLAALSLRAEIGGRWLGGVEGSLWLVGGLHAQGDVLATVARRGLARWLELRGGFGLHLGDASSSALGPAFSLALRTWLPIHRVAGYLRYDGALLLHDATRTGQSAATIGVEASF